MITNSIPPGYAPRHWDEPTCPYTSLDFSDTVIGEYVSDKYLDSHGVLIEAIPLGSKGYAPGGAARAFDTARPRGRNQPGLNICGNNDGDKDLGSPNNKCPNPGPGVGPGGKPYLPNGGGHNRFMNCEPVGMVLIIQESNKSCPDDSSTGGYIEFTFTHSVRIVMAKLLDVDEGNTPEITMTHSSGSTSMTKVEATGDNGIVAHVLDKNDVTKVSIRYFGSGSIAELVFQDCPTTSS